MNRNSSGSLTLSKATTGFLNFKTAEGLAQHTLYSYECILVNKHGMRRPIANRDQALILVLVDTGLRALELGYLKVRDVGIKRGVESVQDFPRS